MMSRAGAYKHEALDRCGERLYLQGDGVWRQPSLHRRLHAILTLVHSCDTTRPRKRETRGRGGEQGADKEILTLLWSKERVAVVVAHLQYLAWVGGLDPACVDTKLRQQTHARA
jgi:hypothetical protein